MMIGSLAPAASGSALHVAVVLQTPDPDRLYANREQLASAIDAASVWETRLADNPQDFEAAWKLARACYWLGAHVPSEDRRRQYERGIEAGRRAVAIDSQRPEGHFWMAANMGSLAESFGLRAGLKYRAPVKRELETVLAMAPSYSEGAADRALGRWYLKVPALFGGSKTRSVEHLQRSLTYDPDNAATHYFLGETYLAMNRRDDARRELLRVLDAPLAPEWIPEIREFQEKARVQLAKLP
jgi:tetratricopeptide (TPR) repeat protein